MASDEKTEGLPPDVHPATKGDEVEEGGKRLRRWQRKPKAKTEARRPPRRGRPPKQPPPEKEDPPESDEPEAEGEEEEVDLEAVREAAREARLIEQGSPGLFDGPPARRAAPSMVTEGAGERPDKFAGIEDLCAHFPIGDGDHFIQVTRRQPIHWQGIACRGIQRPIWEPITQEQFNEIYGGGEYALIVHGPPRRGGTYDASTGKVRPCALMKGAVVLTVPWDLGGYGGYAPNFDSAGPDGGSAAAGEGPVYRRPATPADAQIRKVELDAELRREERMEKRDHETAERSRAERSAEASAFAPVVEGLRDLSKSQVQMTLEHSRRAEEAAAEREREARREAERERERAREIESQANRGTDLSVVAEIAKVLRPGDDGSAQREVTRVTEVAERERERQAAAHAEERRSWEARMESERRLFDDRLKDERDRAERRVREAEESAERKVAEADRRAERLVTEARAEAQRTLDHTEQMYKMRLEASDKQGERDRGTLKDSFESRIVAEKAGLEAKIATQESEIGRLRQENDRLRKEVEDNKDIVKKIGEFTSVAEALGFSKASAAEGAGEESGGLNWKELLGNALMQGMTSLPEVIKNAGESVARVRAAQAGVSQPPPPSVSLPPGPVPRVLSAPPAAAYASATEDGGLIYAEDPTSVPSPFVQAIPLEAPPPLPSTAQEPPTRPAAPSRFRRRPPAAAPQAMPPQHPALGESSGPIAPRPPAELPPLPIPEGQILLFRPQLEEELQKGTDPEEIAREIRGSIGDAALPLAQALTPERIAEIISRQPDGQKSPLLRADGQKWLRRLQQAMLNG